MLMKFFTPGGPRHLRSYYLRFQVYATENWLFFWNLSPSLQSSLDFFMGTPFLYANLSYAIIYFWSLSIAYYEGHL